MALIQFKRGAQTNINAATLAHGEPAWTDGGKLYIGNSDGSKTLVNPDVYPAATKLETKRQFSITGDGTAAAKDFDGTGSVDLALVLPNTNTSGAGTYTKLTVDAKGRVTSATQVTATDVGLQNALTSAAVLALDEVILGAGADRTAKKSGFKVGANTLVGTTSLLAKEDAVKAYVDAFIATLQGSLIFKGTLGTGGTITALPTTYNVGWQYKVITAGTYAGVVCEIGDLITAIISRTGTGNDNADWTVSQANIDGAVVGPTSAIDGRIAVFDGATGKLIKDGGLTVAAIQNANHTGEVTGSTALTITAKAVTNAKMADMAANTIKGNATAAAATPTDITMAALADQINAATITAKATPVDADSIIYTDSAASNVAKRATWTNIKAFLKTYFDTLYNKYTHPNHTGDVTSVADGAQAIAAKAVTNAKMADMGANTIKGASVAGAPIDLTVAQVKTMLGFLDASSTVDGGTF